MVVIEPVVLPVGALPVFWDINKCPVPAVCDARRVGPCIERFLRKWGHSGPISITAIGKLSKVPKEILEAVSSTGIRLYEVPYGRKNIFNHIGLYFSRNCLNPDAYHHVMLISPPRYFDILSRYLTGKGCHIIFPFPPDSSKTLANVLWTTFLLEEDVKCSETVEPANWVCGVCGNLPGRGFENFWTHLTSQEHKLEIFPWFGNDGNVTLPTAKVEQRTQIYPSDGGIPNMIPEIPYPIPFPTDKSTILEHRSGLPLSRISRKSERRTSRRSRMSERPSYPINIMNLPHPCSTSELPSLKVMWEEAANVLRGRDGPWF